MHIEAQQGTVVVKLGASFVSDDARRVGDALKAFAPFNDLVLDFTAVRECHDAAFFSLSDALRGSRNVHLTVRGVNLHQARLLRYLGLERVRDDGRPSLQG